MIYLGQWFGSEWFLFKNSFAEAYFLRKYQKNTALDQELPIREVDSRSLNTRVFLQRKEIGKKSFVYFFIIRITGAELRSKAFHEVKWRLLYVSAVFCTYLFLEILLFGSAHAFKQGTDSYMYIKYRCESGIIRLLEMILPCH